MSSAKKAYKYMLDQIDTGVEFAVAHESAGLKFKLSLADSKLLVSWYDQMLASED